MLSAGNAGEAKTAMKVVLPAGDPLTMERAVEVAFANNPEMLKNAGRVEAALGRADQARKWANPELELATEDFPLRAGNLSNAKNTVGISQVAPWPGKKKLDGRIGAAETRQAEAALGERRLELVREVKSAFCKVLGAERLLEVAGDLVRVAESSARTAQQRVAAGAAADQEQLRAEIILEQAKTELSGFQLDLLAARQALALLLGRTNVTELRIVGALRETVDPGLLQHHPESWLGTHPSMIAARTSQDRAGLELSRARLEPYPDVRFRVAGGREGSGASIMEFGLSLPLPIIDRSRGRKQEAQANLAIAAADSAGTEQRLRSSWGSALERYRTAIDQAANYRERILPKAADALGLVQTGFEQGKFGFIDLLDTQRTTAEVRLAYQQKLIELNLAAAQLESFGAKTEIAPQVNQSSPRNFQDK